jgi:hypothetical protein
VSAPMQAQDERANAAPMNTLFTVVTIAVVVVVLGAALWAFVVAPFWVPHHSGR